MNGSEECEIGAEGGVAGIGGKLVALLSEYASIDGVS